MFTSFINKFLFNLLNEETISDGFTLPELIVSGFVSLLVLLAGITFVRMNHQINNSDEKYLFLSGKIHNALDFMVDEISSGKRLLTNPSQYPKHCKLNKGEFVIGIELPSQALKVEAYSEDYVNRELWKEVDCPITYLVIKEPKKEGLYNYKISRKGPKVNESGFYIANQISNSVIIDKLASKAELKMVCPVNEGWEKKEVRGITICTDKFRRSAQISISIVDSISKQNLFSMTATSGGTNRIIDSELIENKQNNQDDNFDPNLDPIHGDKCTKFRTSMVYEGKRLVTGCYGDNWKWLPDPCVNSKYPQGCFPYSFRTSQGWFPCVSGKRKYNYKVPKGHPPVSSRNCRTYIPGTSF